MGRGKRLVIRKHMLGLTYHPRGVKIVVVGQERVKGTWFPTVRLHGDSVFTFRNNDTFCSIFCKTKAHCSVYVPIFCCIILRSSGLISSKLSKSVTDLNSYHRSKHLK